MTLYYITTFENGEALSCNYCFEQWKELKEYFKNKGIQFKAYTIEQ